jgi:hypothetical protein
MTFHDQYCLIDDEQEKKCFFQCNKDKETIVVWKLYRVCGFALTPCSLWADLGFKETDKTDYFVYPGQNTVKQEYFLVSPPYKKCSQRKGVSVCLTKEAAIKWRFDWVYGPATAEPELIKIIRCTAKVKDLIAIGKRCYKKDHAAFTQINISDDVFNKAIKEKHYYFSAESIKAAIKRLY